MFTYILNTTTANWAYTRTKTDRQLTVFRDLWRNQLWQWLEEARREPALGVWSDHSTLSHVSELTKSVSFIVVTCTPVESYRRRLRSLLLYLCFVFRALINSLVCSLRAACSVVQPWNIQTLSSPDQGSGKQPGFGKEWADPLHRRPVIVDVIYRRGRYGGSRTVRRWRIAALIQSAADRLALRCIYNDM